MLSIWRMFPSERCDKEHCGFNERSYFFTRIGKSLIFQLLPFVFNSRHGSTDSFILVVSPLKMRDQINNYGHPEAIAGKLRKLLYCEDVRRNMRAVVIEEAHLVVEWQDRQVFSVSSYFHLLHGLI